MLRLLLVAVDYFPYRHSGDKNFWFDILPLLAEKLDRVVVLSLNYDDNKISSQNPGIIIYNLRPFRFTKNHELKCGVSWGYLERTITFISVIKMIRELVIKHGINIVHVIDNYGPVQCLIRGISDDVAVTTSAISYHRRYPMYDLALKSSLLNFNKVVCYSETIKNKLLTLGIKNTKLRTIKWGVPLPRRNGDKLQRRRNLCIPTDHRVILWTGYTQQSNYDDFRITLEAAHRIIKFNDKCHFIFAFKPEHFKKEYTSYSCKRIDIVSGIRGKETLSAADILVSPLTSKNIIIAPPLTWLEAMSYGVPIITTPAEGANELIHHGINGFIVCPDKLSDAIQNYLLTLDTTNLSDNARTAIENNFNIEKIADEYCNLWSEVVDEKHGLQH